MLLGGGVGSVFRYAASHYAGRFFGTGFAWGTLTVNLLGCLLIGFVIGMVDRSLLSRSMRVLLVTGFLGGFTTFSSFSLETVRLLDDDLAKGVANILANVLGGGLLTLGGLLLAEKL